MLHRRFATHPGSADHLRERGVLRPLRLLRFEQARLRHRRLRDVRLHQALLCRQRFQLRVDAVAAACPVYVVLMQLCPRLVDQVLEVAPERGEGVVESAATRLHFDALLRQLAIVLHRCGNLRRIGWYRRLRAPEGESQQGLPFLRERPRHACEPRIAESDLRRREGAAVATGGLREARFEARARRSADFPGGGASIKEHALASREIEHGLRLLQILLALLELAGVELLRLLVRQLLLELPLLQCLRSAGEVADGPCRGVHDPGVVGELLAEQSESLPHLPHSALRPLRELLALDDLVVEPLLRPCYDLVHALHPGLGRLCGVVIVPAAVAPVVAAVQHRGDLRRRVGVPEGSLQIDVRRLLL
mmetsp:Transcript_124302/g.359466  ORF Transcript_124302/g.359466 Transcript_124302/m.359466 type:complete len:363 (-) Transcript_124302:161-1249(-)